ncbi:MULTISPECIES: hypothetical protein [Oscillatoriales]|nr:hypothetical protein [Arthrospira platensis NCB002]WAK74234.1 hypothetical protein AP9108_32930 [Arthrospira sp. PCC 9108]
MWRHIYGDFNYANPNKRSPSRKFYLSLAATGLDTDTQTLNN